MRRPRGELVVLVLLVGVFVALTVRSERRSIELQQTNAPTTLSAGRNGLKALYELCEHRGVAVQRWDRPFRDLPRDAGLLWVSEPLRRPLTEAERAGLWRWVRAGGTLVAMPSSQRAEAGDSALDVDGMRLGKPVTGGSWSVGADDDLLRDVGVVQLARGTDLRVTGRAWRVHIGDTGGVILASRRLGSGGVIVMSDSLAPRNQHLQFAGNAVLHVNVAERGMRGRPLVLFDEYHQGYGSDPGDGASLWRSLPRWAQQITALVLVLVLAAVQNGNRRFGSPISLAGQETRPSTEYITSMAGLMRRARCPELPIEYLRDGFVRDLAASVGRTADLPVDRLAELATQEFGALGVEAGALLRTCAAVVSGRRSSELELLRIAIQLHALRGRMGIGRAAL